MRIKQKPEDFVVREAYRFDEAKRGEHYVYLMDKQKLSTLEAVDRIAKAVGAPTREISFCGLKDKQGRTEQIVAIKGRKAEMQAPDLRLKFLGRTRAPLSAANLTANRFVVTVRDLSIEEAERIPASVAEVGRLGVVNYFDSQRFGSLKHGQGFLAKELAFGRVEKALRTYMAKPSDLDRSQDAKIKSFWARHWGEWNLRPQHLGAERYRYIVMRLRKEPEDFVQAFRAIDKRVRAMMVFEYQSYLWNEAVRRYLVGRIGRDGQLVLLYQAGHLVFPRRSREPERLEALRKMTFPLVGPESTFADPEVEKAVRDTLDKERITLDRLSLDAIPDMGFKHEERGLVIVPGKLSVVNPRPDELNRGRLKVTLAFTLPPGAYATLVVRRTLWFAMQDVVEAGGPLPPPAPGFVPEETLAELHSLISRSRTSKRRPVRSSHGIAIEGEGPEGFGPPRRERSGEQEARGGPGARRPPEEARGPRPRRAPEDERGPKERGAPKDERRPKARKPVKDTRGPKARGAPQYESPKARAAAKEAQEKAPGAPKDEAPQPRKPRSAAPKETKPRVRKYPGRQKP